VFEWLLYLFMYCPEFNLWSDFIGGSISESESSLNISGNIF